MSEDNHNPKYTKDMVSWRRDFVLQKLSKGWSQAQIAKELQLHPSTISLDVQFLREQSQRELQTHIKEVIPFEYQKSKQAIQDLIRKANEILDANNEDPKLQLSAINVLTNLLMVNSNTNSQGDIIQQAYDKVSTLEEIQKRAVVSTASTDEEVKEQHDGEDIIETAEAGSASPPTEPEDISKAEEE